jgi:hypothetical protein
MKSNVLQYLKGEEIHGFLKILLFTRSFLRLNYGWNNIKIGSSDLMSKQGVK